MAKGKSSREVSRSVSSLKQIQCGNSGVSGVRKRGGYVGDRTIQKPCTGTDVSTDLDQVSISLKKFFFPTNQYFALC